MSSAGVNPAAGTSKPAAATKSSVNAAAGVTRTRANVPPLFAWTNPVRSGTAFATVLAILLGSSNLLRLVLRLLTWTIGVAFVAEYASRKFYNTNRGVVASYRPSRFISGQRQHIEKCTTLIAQAVDDFYAQLLRVVDAEDLATTGAFFGLSLTGYIFTKFLSLRTIAVLATVVAFTLPPVYLRFQPEIDDLLAKLHHHAGEHLNKVHSQVSQAAAPHLQKAQGHVSVLQQRLGIKRGGPVDAYDASKTPGATGSDSSPSVKKAADSAASTGTTTGSSATASSTSQSSGPTGSSVYPTLDPKKEGFDSIPTMVGNVKLDSGETVPQGQVAADAKAAALEESLKDTIAKDKEQLRNL